ncbi:translation factor Sua5 [candidate division MSBL1 archaeon SCGC-AAA382M17]|uniref:L-threonylcarbamoyladenylate synthase n=1 Tax=candidate division MSBL1 archaeon SCGC-AAA382M17 TaxID=1698284 RepID=A0ABR5TJF2_9EURY|nr:translation factor Sua5 [candidate division MSBL1 archaeon SCGC-AAA382M17]
MKEDINGALEVLRSGGVILYPTDTIWGLGCDATSREAVDRIYRIKGRDPNKSMLVLVECPARVERYVEDMPDIAWDLIDITNKPLTIIYHQAKNLAENLVAADGSIGIRVVQDKFCQQLISRFKKPIVSTSANQANQPAPGNFKEIDQKIIDSVDYVIKWRQNETKKSSPSAIIKLGPGGEVEVIRE